MLRLLLQQRDWRVAAVRLRVAPSVTVDPHWDELHALLCDTAVTFYRIEDHLTEQPDGSLLPSRPRVPVGTYALRTASPYLFIDTLRLLPSMGADSSTVVLSGGAWGEMVFVVPAGGEGRVQGKESSAGKANRNKQNNKENSIVSWQRRSKTPQPWDLKKRFGRRRMN